MINQMFYPAIYLVFLTFVLGIKMALSRFQAVYANQIDPNFYLLQYDGAEPNNLRQLSRHYSNLFELPVIFYLLTATVAILNYVDLVFVILSWIFVMLRTLHALVHITINNLRVRMILFFLGFFVAVSQWVYLVIVIFG